MTIDKTILRHFSRMFEREKPSFDRRMVQFTIFFLVSWALWFLLKLSHEYTTDIRFPIQLVNPPAGKMLIGNQPHTMRIKVKAHGYTLLRYKAGVFRSPIKLSINDFYPVGVSSSNFYMLTHGLRQNFVSQMNSDLELIDVSTDSLFFQMTEVVDRIVNVEPTFVVTYAKQHTLAGDIAISPSSIKITGPKAILDTITSVKTEQFEANLLSSTQSYNIDLRTIPMVSLSNKNVKITFPVERFTETTLSVPITITNIPDSVSLVMLPSRVSVTCNVLMDRYFMLNPTSFTITCNYADRDKIAIGKIRLSMTEYPSYVSRISFYPEFIDYFIKQ